MKFGKKEQAYGIIKKRILEGELPAASDLSEEELIKSLEISRTPIREAIQKLSEEGFVNIYPRKGTIVSEITLDTIRWIYECRQLNEPHITKMACGRLSLNWMLKMQQSFQELLEKDVKGAEDVVQKYIELDRELHDCILDTCTNLLLKNFMKNVYDHSHRLRVKTGRMNTAYESALQEHLDILDALIEGNPEKAEKYAHTHVLEAARTAYKYNF